MSTPDDDYGETLVDENGEEVTETTTSEEKPEQSWYAKWKGVDTDYDGDGDVDMWDVVNEERRNAAEAIGLSDEDGDGSYLDEEIGEAVETGKDAVKGAVNAAGDLAEKGVRGAEAVDRTSTKVAAVATLGLLLFGGVAWKVLK